MIFALGMLLFYILNLFRNKFKIFTLNFSIIRIYQKNTFISQQLERPRVHNTLLKFLSISLHTPQRRALRSLQILSSVAERSEPKASGTTESGAMRNISYFGERSDPIQHILQDKIYLNFLLLFGLTFGLAFVNVWLSFVDFLMKLQFCQTFSKHKALLIVKGN